jgi:peptidoglycan lytic transglycosylase G
VSPKARRLLAGLVALALLLGGAVGWLRARLTVDHLDGSSVEFVVVPGRSLSQVATELVDRGMLRSAWELRLVHRLRSRPIRAGEYDLPRGASPATLLELFQAGRQRLRRVTLVEGWRVERSAAVLADSLGLDPVRLAELIQEPPESLRRIIDLEEGVSLEGFLYPETYHFAASTEAEVVLESILESFATQIDSSMRRRMSDMEWSLHSVVTLASIVEAEAIFDEERPKVAAVYHNRLERGWKLEADPTVAYALQKEGERLIFRDLEVDSAYNTYRHRGLPPGPINSPGLASLRAVLWPQPQFSAMYFVADGTGRHRFSETWDQHRRAVEAYRRARRSASQ